MDIQNAVGAVTVMVALAALFYRLLKARLGAAPAASRMTECLHDIALACFGLALLLRGTPASDLLMACCVLQLIAYLARRYRQRTD